MTENKHQCPTQVWNSFDEDGKVRFNNVMDKSRYRQEQLIHPMALPMQDVDWQALCYNFACIAGWNDFHRDYKDKEPVFTLEDKLKRAQQISGSSN